MLDTLINFTNDFKHVEKSFLASKTSEEAIKVLVDNKFAVTWYVNNKIVEHFETKNKPSTKEADKPENANKDGNL